MSWLGFGLHDVRARLWDLAFVIWLTVSVFFFLGQFVPFITPLLKRLGLL